MNTKTLFYILKRIGLAILTVWVVITVTFFVMHAVPGGPFMSEKAISASAQAALEAKYGLDKPLMEQYLTYLKDIVTKFDFGPSLKQRGRMVIDIIADGMKTSAKLGVIAAVIAGVFGIVLGAVAALRRNKLIDKVIMVITTAFVSMPSFIMGSLLLVLFAIQWMILPANGAASGGLILPIVTLSLYPMAYITRLTRSSMLDVLGQDYIRTAKAKGVSTHACLHCHRIPGGGENLRRARHRTGLRQQHHQPRLSHGDGHHYCTGCADSCYEPGQRHPLQGCGPADQSGVKEAEHG